jgi:hypothetical protein
MNKATRGFVTVATGDYFCYLAENLYRSYRLFSNHEYPLYVITDAAGKERMNNLVDGCIVMENPNYGFLDKIAVYDYTPFDETIFLDADMDITRDISNFFDLFEENQSNISCIGTVKEITDKQRPNHFTDKTIEILGLKQYFSFGGGIYYFRKSETASQCMCYIKRELIPNYDYYGLFGSSSRMTDEALMEVGMLMYNFRPLSSEQDIMKYHFDMMKSLKWDMRKKECSFVWWENRIVHPAIIHYGNANTRSIKYINYNLKVKGLYEQQSKITVAKNIIVSDIKFLIPLWDEKIREAVKKVLPDSVVRKVAKLLHG